MGFSWNPFSRKKNVNVPSEDLSRQNGLQRNPNYGIFRGVNNDIDRIVSQRSIVGQKTAEVSPTVNPVWRTLGVDSDMLLMPVATNKADRLTQYRTIAQYTECQWCLDEICNEFIHEDVNGEYVTLTLPDKKENINETRKEILQEQFKYYMNLFHFRDEAINYIKRFLIEGELAWENVIDSNNPSLGIRGVKYLPAEYYETLIDTKTNSPAGILFDVERLARDIHEILSNNYLNSAQIFNTISPSMVQFQTNNPNAIPMLWSQLTYISSGEKSHDNLVVYPLIEKSRQAYHELALMQQSAVILRVTRAPERLLYNVSTGGMANNLADEFVRDFANSLKAKKVARTGPNGEVDVAQVYNPISMLESYVFGKASNSEGTTIESVGSTADYNQFDDVEYFLRRFMKTLNVPFSRYKTPENAAPQPDQLNYEEYSFLRMIVNIQRRFALGFKNGYITHLKLRGIWDKYDLKDEDIDIAFNKPSMYELLYNQQIMDAKMNIYKTSLGDDKEISKILGMKKYLGFSEAEVVENYKNLIIEKMMTELAEYYGGQVAEKHGLEGWEPPIKFKDDVNPPKEEGEGESGGENGSDEGGSEESSEPPKEEPPEEPEKKEAPEPTFGLS